MPEPKYSAAEQRERMADFELHVKKARAEWKRGRAYIIMSMKEYFDLKAGWYGRASQDAPTTQGASVESCEHSQRVARVRKKKKREQSKRGYHTYWQKIRGRWVVVRREKL